ncbi:helix-turn-helix domain-containing protein [Streptomyces collinus]
MPSEAELALVDAAHIGHILEQIRRHAHVSLETLACKTGTDLHHLTDFLSGRCFPSRRFTLRYARACGADRRVLLMIWEQENARRQTTTGM